MTEIKAFRINIKEIWFKINISRKLKLPAMGAKQILRMGQFYAKSRQTKYCKKKFITLY